MALNWDTTAVENPPHLDELRVEANRDRWARKLESMIWATMAVDMPGFDSDSEAEEFYNRDAVWCVHKGFEPEFTLDDCKHYIGLRTNVVRTSRFAWDAKQRKIRGVK